MNSPHRTTTTQLEKLQQPTDSLQSSVRNKDIEIADLMCQADSLVYGLISHLSDEHLSPLAQTKISTAGMLMRDGRSAEDRRAYVLIL
jgi:hypothetical protein